MSGGEPGWILIVDDDEAARYVKSHLLRRQGYAVSEASLGRETLALAATEESHLTLLDVKLADLSGIEVCREIKSRFPHIIVLQTSAAFTGVADRTRGRVLRPGLPVLLMSGYPVGSVERCDFPILQKPYRREQLAMHIRAALGDKIVLA
jgi:CheY-like chemotaxis protein